MIRFLQVVAYLAAIYFGAKIGIAAGRSDPALEIVVGIIAVILLFIAAIYVSAPLANWQTRFRARQHRREYGE